MREFLKFVAKTVGILSGPLLYKASGEKDALADLEKRRRILDQRVDDLVTDAMLPVDPSRDAYEFNKHYTNTLSNYTSLRTEASNFGLDACSLSNFFWSTAEFNAKAANTLEDVILCASYENQTRVCNILKAHRAFCESSSTVDPTVEVSVEIKNTASAKFLAAVKSDASDGKNVIENGYCICCSPLSYYVFLYLIGVLSKAYAGCGLSDSPDMIVASANLPSKIDRRTLLSFAAQHLNEFQEAPCNGHIDGTLECIAKYAENLRHQLQNCSSEESSAEWLGG